MPLEDMLRDTTRQIAMIEFRVTAQTASLMALLRTDDDTTDVEQFIWSDMDALDDLRRHQWAIRDALGQSYLAASAEHVLATLEANMQLILVAQQRIQELRER